VIVAVYWPAMLMQWAAFLVVHVPLFLFAWLVVAPMELLKLVTKRRHPTVRDMLRQHLEAARRVERLGVAAVHNALMSEIVRVPLNATVMTLARHYALRDVKADVKRRGLSVWDISAKDLREQAHAWLREHPELIAQATEVVEKDPTLRRIAERDGRGRLKRVSSPL
jgi:hypothetical protein